LRPLARSLGKEKAVNQLFGSLVVDAGKARDRLGWRPPFSMEEGLTITMASYREGD
jgi:nucleoside-diphosphate-sugar epimerase